jgi:hypothetical protein
MQKWFLIKRLGYEEAKLKTCYRAETHMGKSI